MTYLMKKIMAEVECVNKLNAEVDKVVADRNAETMVCRVEKEKEIMAFLQEMHDALKSAGVSGYVHAQCCGDNPFVDKYSQWKWPLGVELCKNFVRIGEFNCMMSFSENSKVRNTFIDRWDEAAKLKVEHVVAEAIKVTLKQRMEKMADDLKKANADHDVYFGKENA